MNSPFTGRERLLKKFLDTGGSLIIDAAGGSTAFNDAAEVMLRAMYGRDAIKRLSARAEVYTIPNYKIETVKYRRQAKVSLGRIKTPNLRGVMIGQRIAVMFSREDVTGGLVGYPCYTAIGYEPVSAYEIMRNCVCYAAAIKPQGHSLSSPAPKAADANAPSGE